jgi:hypothetical protein
MIKGLKGFYFGLLMSMLFLTLFVVASNASNNVYDGTPLSNGYVAVTTNYPLNLSQGLMVDYLSFQAIYSTATFTTISGSTATANANTDTINTTQALPVGYSVLYSSTAFSWGGLTNRTTYYVIPYNATSIKLATTQVNAVAGTAVDITSSTIALNKGTFTLAPIVAKTGVAYNFGIKWQYSNDNQNWFDSTLSTRTITYNTASTNYLWDFQMTTYKYIRCQVIQGTWGAIKLKLQGYGKRMAP